MAVPQLLIHVLLSLIQNVLIVGDDLDLAMHDRMQERQGMLSREMTRLLREIEQRGLVLWGVDQRGLMQKIQEQHRFIWNTLVFAALQLWQFWVVAGVLVLLFGLWWLFRKRSHEIDTSDEKSSSRNMEEVEEKNGLERISEEHVQCPVQDSAKEFKEAKNLVFTFVHIIRHLSSNSFFPVLQRPIEVGITFEGCEDDSIYHFLVPMKPPRGHAFHMKMCIAEDKSTREFCIRVELVCTCTVEQRVQKTGCLLHQSEEELRGNQGLSLLHTLCTGFYLDVEKTACWFSQNVEEIWKTLPQSSQHSVTVLPSSRSCKLQVTKGSQKIFRIEVEFGVQLGDSDVFLSSQTAEANFTPSTAWPESYAMAVL